MSHLLGLIPHSSTSWWLKQKKRMQIGSFAQVDVKNKTFETIRLEQSAEEPWSRDPFKQFFTIDYYWVVLKPNLIV